MEEILYGLDLSLSCTGVTVYSITQKKVLYIGSLNTEKITLKKPEKDKNIYLNGKKLKAINDWMQELIKQYPPTVVCIERGFSRFNTSTQVVYRCHGIINLLFADHAQIYYPPKSVKEAIYKGTATKQQLQRVILNNYPDLEFNNEDESDSFAVALTYLLKNNLIEFEKPIVDKPKKKKTKKTEE